MELLPLELRIAAQRNTLDAILEGYRAEPQRTPGLEDLRAAAREIQQAGQKLAARKILEFVFRREIEERKLTAANLLGLAEIRLESGDTNGAMELLRRMTLVVGTPFENLDSAAALLEKTGHPAEAAQFLDQLVKAVPWIAAYRLRLAKAEMATAENADVARDSLAAIATNTEVPYETRVGAATALAGSRPQANLASDELKLLVTGAAIPAAEANKPFFYPARLKAAEQARSEELRLEILRSAVEERPNRDAARLPLFRAFVASGQSQLAWTTMEPLLQSGFLGGRQEAPAEEEEESETTEGQMEATRVRASDLGRLSAAEQASIASALGLVLEKLDRWEDAVRYLRLAVRLEPIARRRTDLTKKISDLRALRARNSANASRQPLIHDALEQDRVVRPRLQARAAPPPAVKATIQGGKAR